MLLVEGNAYMGRELDGASDVVVILDLFNLIISCCVDNALEK
jgi:hypothetical protein